MILTLKSSNGQLIRFTVDKYKVDLTRVFSYYKIHSVRVVGYVFFFEDEKWRLKSESQRKHGNLVIWCHGYYGLQLP